MAMSDFIERNDPTGVPEGAKELDLSGIACVAPPDAMELKLRVEDQEVLAELSGHREGPERNEFALGALRLGILSLKIARGQVDELALRNETDRLLDSLREGFEKHRATLDAQLSQVLKGYFDPEDGRFAERVEKLVKEDGELSTIIRRQVSGDDSALAKTLAAHFGSQSPIMRLVDPTNSEGLLRSLEQRVDEALRAQRERILAEFSMDNEEGSLRRLVKELNENHGKLTGNINEQIDEVRKQFSLNDENSALSRLVEKVNLAQERITQEFSLDSEESALSRLQNQLMEVVNGQLNAINHMEKTVAEQMAALDTRRKTAQRTTLRGHEFEDRLGAFLETEALSSGDLFEATGTRPGQILNCKTGDFVLELGEEHGAAGARIVFEAKEAANYNREKARAELERACKNRDAQVGVFVFSSSTAPEGLELIERYGDSILVIWDANDSSSGAVLRSVISIAKTLCVRQQAANEGLDVDVEALESAIRTVEKELDGLQEIEKAANTIERGSQRILKRARLMLKSLESSVEELDACACQVREAVSEE